LYLFSSFLPLNPDITPLWNPMMAMCPQTQAAGTFLARPAMSAYNKIDRRLTRSSSNASKRICHDSMQILSFQCLSKSAAQQVHIDEIVETLSRTLTMTNPRSRDLNRILDNGSRKGLTHMKPRQDPGSRKNIRMQNETAVS
jgi:hypothetical protein